MNHQVHLFAIFAVLLIVSCGCDFSATKEATTAQTATETSTQQNADTANQPAADQLTEQAGEKSDVSVKYDEVNAAQFKQKTSSDGLVLTKFGAPWCAPCKELDGELDKLEADYPDRLTIVRVNIDDEPELASEYEISLLPTMILFKDGQQLGIVEFGDAEELRESIDAMKSK